MSTKNVNRNPSPCHRPRFEKGVWVMSSDVVSRPQLGRVLSVSDDGAIDVVIYGASGFEPCCSADLWTPIQRPDFEKIASLRYDYRGELVPLEAS